MIVTVNPSIKQTSECSYVSVEKVLNRFKSGNQDVEALRKETDKDKQDELKNQLPVVIFQGKFARRANSALIKSSGLMILDFDCDTESMSLSIASKLAKDEYIYSYFKSPRGYGYKALVQIPEVQNDKEYKGYYFAFQERYKELDDSGKDIARACFVTSDPDLVINENAAVWDKTKELAKRVTGVSDRQKQTDLKKLNIAVNMIRGAQPGNRHNTIRSASRLCGGWVVGGVVDEQDALSWLTREANQVAPETPENNYQTILDAIEHGKSEPLTEQQQENEIHKAKVQEKYDKIAFSIGDVSKNLDHRYQDGIAGYYDSGWKQVDDIYRMYPGYTTYLYGPPFSGKSQLWLHYLYQISCRYGLTHVVFSPETGDKEDVFSKLIEIRAGSSFYDTGYGKMTPEQFESALKWVGNHFIVVDPEDNEMTMDDMFSYCEIVERDNGIKIDTITIDPWNDLDHDMGDERDDIYLQKKLKKARKQAKTTGWHIAIVTHARDQQPRKGFNENGDPLFFYPPASFRDVAGGQAWSRRGFQMVSVWRPPVELAEFDGESLKGNEVYWIQQKFKPEYAGAIGKAKLHYNVKEKRYYEWSHTAGSIYPDLTRQTETSKPEPQPQPQQSEEVPF